MSEEQEQTVGTEAPAELKTAQIEFKGRMVTVGMPGMERIAAFQAFNRELKRMKPGELITGEEAVAIATNALNMILSLLVNRADRLWLTDELSGDTGLDLEQCQPFVEAAMEAIRVANPANRAERRANEHGAKLAI